jgi:acyl-CoA synthetase (AMP-forming)/AMP-acid ligase II
MWIRGPTVFKGYHDNPSASAEALTPDGFFKTGDIAYEDAAGNLFITDRVKELIKYKGSQVAPAELEGIILSHPHVDDVAVIGIYAKRIETEVPMAFIVAKQGVTKDEKTAKEIVEWVAGKTARTKWLRGGVVWMEQIPKSASGKILRRVLKELMRAPDAKGVVGAMVYEDYARL